MFKACAVIPVYNHERAVGAVINGVLEQGLPCIVVDDGSAPACANLLDGLANADSKRITLLRHKVNCGKGSAVLTGLRHAYQAGYSHAVQIDADGQHRSTDIPLFVSVAAAHPDALILGCPEYDGSAPPLRLYARRLTYLWVAINTLSRQIEDSMCGFRVYPVAPVIALDRRRRLGARMDFDIEIAVRLSWSGAKIINLPTAVVYPDDGVSHFCAWSDNVRISLMHANLFFGMLLRLPMLLARRKSVS
jgi:glycosyltransferase involved in cell wall biosynthesis